MLVGGFVKFIELVSAFGKLMIEFYELVGGFGKFSELVSGFSGLVIEFDGLGKFNG